ncbi:claudin-like protein ZF-A9 [Amia ocellicauda]|uniref:claudin-like protein ZF-A9 n=1 Tax=Amia ocellicauda TaxID=2972642 RepID=UPI003463B428|nr:CLDZ protein [Amia calva]
MASTGLQILAVALGVLGWLGVIVACVLPLWRVTAFTGNNIVTAQVFWEGLWMSCAVQSTGQMQCKVYDSMLALSQDLQASRALLVIGILVGVVGLLASVVGGKCTKCMEGGSTKARVTLMSGVLFLVAGLLCLVPPCWSANRIIRDFYDPLVSQEQKRELGAAIFICWASSGLLLTGGSLLCCSACEKEGGDVARYKLAHVEGTSREYVGT